ncbi:MAG TPA: diaminopimelate epimerase [Gemmatimonadaceae bacterium]|nr:diaminopimelate epimerase [Gemmatimonadaceae bacterium]
MLEGLAFWKLTGSGNDFVFFDARRGYDPALLDAAVIDGICDRRTGVGADGIVLFEEPVEPDAKELYSIRYFNRDGTLAEFCGNAALCSVRLADILGVIPSNGERFNFHSSSGMISGGIHWVGASSDDPTVSMPQPVETQATCDIALARWEERIGFTRVGVPHLVVVVDDLEAVPLTTRGRELRMHSSLRSGANVNFIQKQAPRRWAMRTYERGVEAETLACGSGSVAVATLLGEWGLEPVAEPVTILARGGRELAVSWTRTGAVLHPWLSGEGRLVYSGTLAQPLHSPSESTSA